MVLTLEHFLNLIDELPKGVNLDYVPQLLHRHLSCTVPITTRLSVQKMQMKG